MAHGDVMASSETTASKYTAHHVIFPMNEINGESEDQRLVMRELTEHP